MYGNPMMQGMSNPNMQGMMGYPQTPQQQAMMYQRMRMMNPMYRQQMMSELSNTVRSLTQFHLGQSFWVLLADANQQQAGMYGQINPQLQQRLTMMQGFKPLTQQQVIAIYFAIDISDFAIDISDFAIDISDFAIDISDF